MIKVFAILFIITFLAYLSQNETMKYSSFDARKKYDIYLILLIIFMTLICGLRTYYNDTANYIRGFENSVLIKEFLSNPENFKLTHNPLFYGYQALIRTFSDNFTVFFMISGIIVNFLNVRFIKRYTDKENFAFSMFLYVTLGILMLSCAAQKQCLAMSILTIALPYLFDRKFLKYYIVVFIAGLVHTYAWVFLFLPILYTKPWSFRTYVLLAITIAVMLTFQNTITTFLEVADEVGKNIPMEEVFDNNRMNLFRVGVFGVLPLISWFFLARINSVIDTKHAVYIQMTIVAFMFTLMGTMNGANMFGRCANYFIMGTICGLPWVIRHLFTKQSATLVFLIAAICYTGFYYRDSLAFSYSYQYKTLPEFIVEIIS